MRFKSTWIFFILLVAIASYYFLVEEKRREADERERKASKRILPYGKDDIERITLVNPQGDRIELEKTDSEWIITSPTLTDAAQTTIDAFLTQLVPGHKTDYVAGVTDFRAYGLNIPYATVIFFAADRGSPDTIHVGDKTPTSSSCYVRIGETDTVLVSREMTHNLVNKTLYHLRDKNFTHVSSGSIDSLLIRGGEYPVKLVKRGETWWFEDPPVRADSRTVEDYLATLTTALIRGFASEDTADLATFGLEKPDKTIDLYHGDAKTQISFGDTDEDFVFVVRTGLDKVLQLEEQLLDPFRWTKDDLRAWNLSFFSAGDVTTIRYETPDTAIVVERGLDGWRIGGEPVRHGNVEGFLRQLGSIRFTEILEEGIGDPVDLSRPFSLEVSLWGREANLIDRIVFLGAKGPLEEAASKSSNIRGRIEYGRTGDLKRLIEGS
jgi:hypothetical protein